MFQFSSARKGGHHSQRAEPLRNTPVCFVTFHSPNRGCYLRWDHEDIDWQRSHCVPVADIDWIEAAGAYANLHIGGKEVLYRASLNELAKRPDPVRFVRVHRSAIVSIESILHLEAISYGEVEAILKDGSRSRISRTYRREPEKRLGQSQ